MVNSAARIVVFGAAAMNQKAARQEATISSAPPIAGAITGASSATDVSVARRRGRATGGLRSAQSRWVGQVAVSCAVAVEVWSETCMAGSAET